MRLEFKFLTLADNAMKLMEKDVELFWEYDNAMKLIEKEDEIVKNSKFLTDNAMKLVEKKYVELFSHFDEIFDEIGHCGVVVKKFLTGNAMKLVFVNDLVNDIDDINDFVNCIVNDFDEIVIKRL